MPDDAQVQSKELGAKLDGVIFRLLFSIRAPRAPRTPVNSWEMLVRGKNWTGQSARKWTQCGRIGRRIP